MSKRSRSSSRSPPFYQPRSSPSPSTPQAPSKIHLPDTASQSREVMRCSLAPHKEILSFASYDDYEVHYLQVHVNRCIDCGKNFPTEHLLGLHIEENHDPLVSARRERGEKTYSCFIKDCSRKCSTPQKRTRHLIDKHMFPPTYNFNVVSHGIDRQTSMLRKNHLLDHKYHTSGSTISKTDHIRPVRNNGPPESSPMTEIDELGKAMSALQFVPRSVTKVRRRLEREP